MRNHRHAAVAISRSLIGLLIGLLFSATGCQKGTTNDKPAPGSGSATAAGMSGSGSAKGGSAGSAAPAAPPVEAKDIDSKDILARTETAPEVQVKHVLLGWKELAPIYGGRMDPRAGKRTNPETAALAQEIATKLKASPDSIDALIKESSEDPGSLTGDAYTVRNDSSFVPEFTNLALRLKEKEVGIVKTKFGYHVMERVPPDPLESADILARPPEAEPASVQHILIGWKDSSAARAGAGDKRAIARTKADADKLAAEVLAKVRNKGDMAKLMKEYSEDPGSKDNAKVFEIAGNMPRGFESFKNLAVRLKLDEAGLTRTPLGWHIIKRVTPPPPPPPDPLDSTDILKREAQTQSAKVKHILLGWKEVHTDDERGKKRDRKELEKLVKATVAKLKKGDKIEPLMAELSEDTSSAKAGTSFDVTPTAGLVPPFKNLSLRLKLNEVGAVKSDFGIHIIQRVE
jgi:parvulin-like peptidyl-prolyl isomerase